MNNFTTRDTKPTKIIGNTSDADASYGFKKEISDIFEQYATEGVNLPTDLYSVLSSPTTEQNFVDMVMESVVNSPALTSGEAKSDPFYSNYAERLAQLAENSNREIVQESVMTSYAPITAYAPFFLKKQWISCVMKDVLLTEVPTSPIINYQFQRRYIVDMEGNKYEMPDVYKKKDVMKKLIAQSTGVAIKETPIKLPLKNENLVDTTRNADPSKTYLEEGFVTRDLSQALNPDMFIFKVIMTDPEDSKQYELPCSIMLDVTTHNFMKQKLSYAVKDGEGNVKKTLEDEVIGTVDFDTSSITVMSVNGIITHICLRGKTSNRFNHRSLDVRREVTRLERVMPESGPRFNSPVTIEEAADAISTGNIDMFADNADMMGNALANFEDIEIRSFLDESYDRQMTAKKQGLADQFGYTNLVEEGTFSALPFGGFSNNISEWIKDAKEYFERILEQLKYKLETDQCIVTCVCHPSLIRFIQGELRWVFDSGSEISGMKLQHNFAVSTAGGDKIRFVTTRYMDPDDGIRFILIPTTTDLITFKHLKYSVTVDRGYRHPLEPLVPNLMATQRTLTFEVIPVQGKMKITGRGLNSPENVGYSTVQVTGPVQTVTG